MKSSSSTEFTASDGRSFAFPVGIAFLALAGLALWREHDTVASALALVGGALLFSGLVLPSKLGGIYRAWMAMALAISKVTTPIFMGLVYFLILTPTGLAMRLLGRNPMVHKPVNDSYWFDVSDGHGSSGDMRRQF